MCIFDIINNKLHNFKISDDALRRVKEGRDLVDKIVAEKRGMIYDK